MPKLEQRSGEESTTKPVAKTADDLKPKPADSTKKAESSESKSGAGGGGGAVAAPMPALPKGGGAIRGIGEKFSVNPVTGTASLQVPIVTSPGRAGFHPELSLAYDSGAGNGPFGHGFHLSVPQITRKTDKGLPRYDDAAESDVFIMSGAEDLVPKLDKDTGEPESFEEGGERVERFSPRVEGGFVRIERRTPLTAGGDGVYWMATTADNVTSVYGKHANARIAKPGYSTLVFSWLLEETQDDKGNVIAYEYKDENLQDVPQNVPWEANRHKGVAKHTNKYLKRIHYGNTTMGEAPTSATGLFEVVFDYGEHDADAPTPVEVHDWKRRDDPFSSYRAGFDMRTYRLCRRVLMFHKMAELGAPYLVASTDFTYAPSPVLTQLVSATHSGYIRAASGYTKKSHPPLDFAYAPATLQTKVRKVDKQSLQDLPAGVQGMYQWVDLDGEGLPGVLSQQGGALWYKKNLGGGRLAPARVLMSKPSMAQLGSQGQQIADIDGDGEKELVLYDGAAAGYHDRLPDGTWGPFKTFPSQPSIDWSDPNLRFVDLTGDGLEDVLLAWYDNRFLWFKSMGKKGFAQPVTYHKWNDEERSPGPRVVFADEVQTIFLADMSGDGLTDIVRIRNGNICYWPNIGNGRFGAKVQMGGLKPFDNPDQFDPKRIRLADVDGSGTTDILYVHRDGIRFHANQAGNSFAPPVTLARFPDHSDLSTITAIDLLGTGTACLVWSSSLPSQATAPMRYIDLMNGKKPYLMETITNNLGLTTTLQYVPSTKLYRDDAVAGKPWITKLPFPVQTLARTETYDAVSKHRFVSVYKYHHGYFDGAEREFRGFGMVEQWDTESWSAFSGVGELPPANATGEEFHQPPVYTKTWFHTGAWKAGKKIAQQYIEEYWRDDPKAVLLDDTILPGGLTAEEAREACRALKGQILRQETYTQDGTLLATRPYLVSERSYDVQRVQPMVKVPAKGLGTEGRVTHGVFFTHPREAIEYHYERTLDDPRITHALTLEVDDYGGVTKSAAVGYPRRSGQGALSAQEPVAITLNEIEVFHHAPSGSSGWYRIGVPIETRTYQLTGLALQTDAIYTLDALKTAAAAAAAIEHETPTSSTALQKRLLSESQTRYYTEDLSGEAAKGAVPSHALPYRTYAKAFTHALITGALEGHATEAILVEGGYLRLSAESDAPWWVPSGIQVFDDETFYLPVSFKDPFNNQTTVTYDEAYHLFVTQVTDPLGNNVHAAYDLRTLAPYEITDPNGNRAQARFDELGMVVATAVMGKVNGADGDTLDDPTTTFAYDLDRFRLTGKPNMVHLRARERHGDPSTPWQESYSYSDGSGHEVMRKVQAEPGMAPGRDGDGALVHDNEGQLVWVETTQRWVGTGRTVFDNKGNPIKQYEPFFSGTYEYEEEAELVEWGVTPILRYDGLGRLTRTDLPNGTYSKVDFDPWKETRYDPNDTVADSLWYASRASLPADHPERQAADKAYLHRNTPSVVHLDALGRPFETIEDNGAAGQYATTVELDIEGNTLSINDHRGVVVQESIYAMGGVKLWQKSCDAGERWMLGDVGGALLRAWDQRGFTRRAQYDGGRRPTHLWVQAGSADDILVERTVYGELLGTAAAASNLRGKPYLHYDGAGVVTSVAHDFKGNLLESRRRLATDYQSQLDWSALAALTDPTAITAAAEAMLEAELFTAHTAYDALNRPISLTAPDSSEIRPGYNEAGLLERVDVRVRGAATWTAFVDDIDYDAKGQREQIVYGAGATTTKYAYDPLTYRMTQLKTTRAAGLPGEQDDDVLQNLGYTYDPVGNITEIHDSAHQTVFFASDVVLPKMAYVYDALYRLTQATGREQAGANADVQRDQDDVPLFNLPHANDAQAVRNYTESYAYDAVGNILSMIHDGGSPATSWTRRYDISTTSNRLLGTSVAGDDPGEFSAPYTYDDHGNMISMPHLPSIEWNHRDEMVSADKGGGGMVYFTYDAAGQRVRKVYEHSGLIEERIYLGGFEVYRKRVASTGELTLERETLHVMDGVRRIALVETKTVDASIPAFTPTTVTRLQLGNHLGSASLEVDLTGLVISYEEYHPYGTTAYHSATSAVEVSRKRYRYTGKERDEETGLYYHGARYYAPWLGRWTAADPIGIRGGINNYGYCHENPMMLVDSDGQEPAPVPPPKKKEPMPPREFVKGRDEFFVPDAGPPPGKAKPLVVVEQSRTEPERTDVAKLKPSNDILEFVKEKELAKGGVMDRKIDIGRSKGYGHDILKPEELTRLRDIYGSELDDREALVLLKEDLEVKADDIRKQLKGVKLTQGEFDALVSQHFNSALFSPTRRSRTVDAIKEEKSHDEIVAPMLDAVTSNEPHLKDKGAIQGLAERRFEELKIFSRGSYPSRNDPKVVALAEQFVKEYNQQVPSNGTRAQRLEKLGPLQRRFVPLARQQGVIR